VVVEDGGIFFNQGVSHLGVNAGAEGLLRIGAGGRFSTSNALVAGQSGKGIIIADGFSRVSVLPAGGTDANITLGAAVGSEGFLYNTNSHVSAGYNLVAGSDGSGYLEIVGGTNSTERALFIGRGATGNGVVHLKSGALKIATGQTFGDAGNALLIVDDGAAGITGRGPVLGNTATGRAQVFSGVTAFTMHNDGVAVQIGVSGRAEWVAKGTLFDMYKSALIIRANPGGFGVFRGYGTVTFAGNASSPPVRNNGLLIADGFGEEHDWDFSSAKHVNSLYPRMNPAISTIENDGTNGVYAVNKGRFVMGGSTLTNNVVTWMEHPDDPEIDMVNSARIVFPSASAWANKVLTGALYAADRSDIPGGAALAKRGVVAGVWKFDYNGVFDSADAQFRYDHAAVGKAQAALFQYTDGGWKNLGADELPGFRLETRGLGALGWFAAIGKIPETFLIVR
jgi:hypothetical protein